MGKKLEIKKDIFIKNRRASFDYQFLEKFHAGIALKGSEVKSVRLQNVTLQDSYCLFIGKELYVRGMHISPYEMGGHANHEAKRDRKLLLKRKELNKLQESLKEQGLTIVVTHVMVNERGLIKVGIALAKGKKLYDKRQDIKTKDAKRDIARSGY
ncbi:SsrA-binding protein SmpB [Algivirga pacifica]|uniref:SsrA-binding protein n=1 Tax=Algivirga pacifica TaxID=1162670 RepID=A0ABP9DKJ9_9BACT